MNKLSIEERDVLATILRFHGAEDATLAEHLEGFAEWIRDIERSRLDRSVHPKFPLVLLSLMGIYGKDALSKRKAKP